MSFFVVVPQPRPATGKPTYAAGRLHGCACTSEHFGGTAGLRRKQIDILTAQDDSAGRMSDDDLLTRATAVGRVLLTQDTDFHELAARWQRQGIAFNGILFARQGTPIGQLIEDDELCLAGMTADEFRNRLVHLPLR